MQISRALADDTLGELVVRWLAVEVKWCGQFALHTMYVSAEKKFSESFLPLPFGSWIQ
jgi:hypothetical protein